MLQFIHRSNKPTERNTMQKLIVTFKANNNDVTRAKLQAYIRKHPMAVCMLTAEEFQFLKTNGFSL